MITKSPYHAIHDKQFFAAALVVLSLVTPISWGQSSRKQEGIDFIGSDLQTREERTRLILSFETQFDYEVSKSGDKRSVTITWPEAIVLFPEGMVWRTDHRITSIQLIQGRNLKRPWDGMVLSTSSEFTEFVDFWMLDRANLIIDVKVKESDPLTERRAREARRRLENLPLPDSYLRARDEDIGFALARELATPPNESKARTREGREQELTDFLTRLPEAYAEKDMPVAGMLRNRDWLVAAQEMRRRLREDPQAKEALIWLFLNGEFLYRAMLEDRVGAQAPLRAFRTFTRVAPEHHELAPYAFYRMAEIYHRLDMVVEEAAHIAAARSHPSTPFFDDLFAIHQANVFAELKKTDAERDLLRKLIERFPSSAVRPEAEYLLGEISWKENTDWSRVDAYEHFRSMIELTTAPLTNKPARKLVVAQALVHNQHCDDARPFLRDLMAEAKTSAPTEEMGEAWLLLAECLRNEGQPGKAIEYYEKAEHEDLPPRLRMRAALSLADISHEDFLKGRMSKTRSHSPSYLRPVQTAQRIYKEAKDPDVRVLAGYKWGQFEAERGNFKEAVNAYMAVSRDFPQSLVRANLEEFIVTFFREAVAQAYQQKDYKDVVHFFVDNLKLASELPLDRQTRDWHAKSLMKLGFYEEAVNIWLNLYSERLPDGSLKDTPPPPELMLDLANGLEKTRRPLDALTVLNERLNRFPTQESAWGMLIRSRCYMKLDQSERAVHALEQAIDGKDLSQEDRVDAYHLLAQAYMDQQQFGNAELTLQKGLQSLAADRVAFSRSEGARKLIAELGRLYYTKNQVRSAIQIYARYIRLYPEAPDRSMCVYRLGQLFLQVGDIQGAEETFKSLAANENEDKLYRDLAKATLEDMDIQFRLGDALPE